MAEVEARSFAYELNDLVVLENLQKTPEYNGRLGVVKEHLTSKSRITVKVFEFDKLLNVKEDNLRAAADGELKDQLPAAFDKLRKEQIETILSNNNVSFEEGSDKSVLITAAVAAKLVPEPVKKKADPDEVVQIPGGGSMTRREMLERAKQLESMSSAQMREQLRVLTSRSPQELRSTVPAMRQMTDADIQNQITQLQQFVNNPRLKKLQIEALKTGDFSKLNMEAASTMSDREIRENAKKQLEAFKADPEGFRKQYFPDSDTLTNEDIEEMLNQQANADAATLEMLRSGGSGGAGKGMDLSNMSEEQFKKNAELQIKMFKSNPKRVREQLEKQNPEMRGMSDEQILFQLETMASKSKKDLEEMTKMAKASGMGPGGRSASMTTPPNMDNMTGEQIKAMFKTQREMFKRDPKAFRKVVPQMEGMSDEAIQTQLDIMADMDPNMLKVLMSFQSRLGGVYNTVKGPLDRISGGRGQQIIGFVMLTVLFLVFWYLMSWFFRLLAYLFPTTFGYSSTAGQTAPQAAAAAAGATGGAVHTTQVEVNVDDDAFFQDNEDL